MRANDIYNSFLEHKSTLKETSLDDSDKEHLTYMTESSLGVIDFDLFKETYAQERVIQEPCSCDALLLDKNNELNFIEFKNIASRRNLNRKDIREKVYCSLLMFSDEVNHTLKDITKHVNFIFVYNASLDDNQNGTPNTNIQRSQSYRNFTQFATNQARTPIIRFGFDIFKTFCFKEVYTLNQEEFEEHLKNISLGEQAQ